MPGVTRAFLLIDHDNVPWASVSLRSIFESWIGGCRESLPDVSVVDVRVRAYGGWFEGEDITDARFDAASHYQQSCPAIMQVQGLLLRTHFEFADRLLHDSDLPENAEQPRIHYTYVVRSAAQLVAERSSAPPCNEPTCELDKVRKWIRRRRACLSPHCSRGFSDQLERREQKQVDVHLALDAVQLAREGACQALGVASDDWDLLPAFLAASRRPAVSSVTTIRFREEPRYLDSHLRMCGVRIVHCR